MENSQFIYITRIKIIFVGYNVNHVASFTDFLSCAFTMKFSMTSVVMYSGKSLSFKKSYMHL